MTLANIVSGFAGACWIMTFVLEGRAHLERPPVTGSWQERLELRLWQVSGGSEDLFVALYLWILGGGGLVASLIWYALVLFSFHHV